jgi:hypothetical protein
MAKTVVSAVKPGWVAHVASHPGFLVFDQAASGPCGPVENTGENNAFARSPMGGQLRMPRTGMSWCASFQRIHVSTIFPQQNVRRT